MSNQPAILYQSVLTDATTGNELTARAFTYDTLTQALDETESCSAIGIARPSRTGTVTVQSSTNGTSWTTRGIFSFARDRVMMGIFDSVSAAYWRVIFDSPTTLSVVKLGAVVRMPQRNYAGVAPPSLNQVIAQAPAAYDRGMYLGRQAYGRVSAVSVSQERVTMAQTRTDVMPLVEAMRRGAGAFVAWRPEKYPGDVVYGFLDGDIRPTNTGTRDYMSLSIAVTGVTDSAPAVYDKPTVTAPGA
jgi:hypothetical protein